MTIYPNLHANFFALEEHESLAVEPGLLDFEKRNGVAYDYEDRRCGATTDTPLGQRWFCNYPSGHNGHHDAWIEAEGWHVAHWRNEEAEYVIQEETDLVELLA